MKIVSVSAKNFLSFESLSYTFKDISILIQGENNTDANQKSNGVGKTAFQSIIEYAFYGNTSHKVRDKELIRYGQVSAMISIVVSCNSRKQVMHITRTIKQKGTSELQIFINDEEVKFATINDGNRQIMEWLAISKDDLQTYYIINKERYRSFFSSSNVDKIKTISRFSNIDLIDGVEGMVNMEVEAITAKGDDLRLQLAKKQGVVETLKNTLEQKTVEAWAESRDMMIEKQKGFVSQSLTKQETLSQDNSLIKKELKGIKIKMREAQSKRSSLEEKLKDVDTEKYKSRIKKIDQSIPLYKELVEVAEEKKGSMLNQIDEIVKQKAEIEKQLAEVVKCPKCTFEFNIFDEKSNIEDLRSDRGHMLSLIEKGYEKLNDINSYLDQTQKKINGVRKIKEQLQLKLDQINDVNFKIKREIESIVLFTQNQNAIIERKIKDFEYNQKEIERQDDLIESYHKTIEDLRTETYNDSHKKLIQKNIYDEEKLIENLEIQIKENEQHAFETGAWVSNFKKFQSYLANQFLKTIEGLANSYLNDFQSDLQIRWEGYKIKADGSLSDRITPYIYRDNIEREYWSFSGGERARMDLAMILALRDLINTTHPYGGLDFLFTDEIFEGLDSVGLHHLLKAISVFKFPVLVTTHVTERNLYSDTLTIVKNNGISCLNEN